MCELCENRDSATLLSQLTLWSKIKLHPQFTVTKPVHSGRLHVIELLDSAMTEAVYKYKRQGEGAESTSGRQRDGAGKLERQDTALFFMVV